MAPINYKSTGGDWLTLDQWQAIVRDQYRWNLQLAVPIGQPQDVVAQRRSWGDGDIRLLQSHAAAATATPCDDRKQPLRLVYLLSGSAQITARCGSAVSDVREGDLFVLDAAAVGQATWSEHAQLCLTLPERYGTLAVADGCPQAVLPVNEPVVSAALKAQLHLIMNRGVELGVDGCERLLASLVDATLMALNVVGGREPELRDISDALLKRAQLYIQANYQDDLSVKGLAAALGCSRSTLYRAFEVRSLSVMGYVRETRLVRSRAALATCSVESSIEQVAGEHGFTDMPAFIRSFQRRFGVTPGQVCERKA